MSDKQRVDIIAVNLAFAVFRYFDNLNLNDIVLTEDGTPLPISDEMLDEWKFVSLPNSAFVEMRIWEDENHKLKEET